MNHEGLNSDFPLVVRGGGDCLLHTSQSPPSLFSQAYVYPRPVSVITIRVPQHFLHSQPLTAEAFSELRPIIPQVVRSYLIQLRG